MKIHLEVNLSNPLYVDSHPITLKFRTERVGFEPTVPSPEQLLSRQPDSTTLAPLLLLGMPRRGLEPLQSFNHKHLKLACLPVPPPRQFVVIDYLEYLFSLSLFSLRSSYREQTFYYLRL